MRLLIYGGTSHTNRLEKMLALNNFSSLQIVNINRILESDKTKFRKAMLLIRAIHNSDSLYMIFCGLFSKVNFLIVFCASILGKPIVNHWIGTDVLFAVRNPYRAKIMQYFIKHNLAGSKLLQEELLGIGIRSEVVPIVLSDISMKMSLMPKTHAVLVYMPNGREKFYGYDIIVQLIETFPNLRFYIVANDEKKKFEYDNVTLLGQVSTYDMDKVYNMISILVRIPEHDGLSLMVLEALAKGKTVIYKYGFPYTIQATNSIQAKEALTKILAKGPPLPNYSASAFINKEYNSEKYIHKLMDAINGKD